MLQFSSHVSIRLLFASDSTERGIFCCIMNKNRFSVLILILRFDNPWQRWMQKVWSCSTDLSGLWKYVSNCQAVYTIGSCACVDKMLVSFCGHDTAGSKSLCLVNWRAISICNTAYHVQEQSIYFYQKPGFLPYNLSSLLKKIGLTYVGAWRSNKRKVPR